MIAALGDRGREHVMAPSEENLVGEIAGGVHLHDVSALMPRRPSLAKTRDVEAIDRLFVHHSGALGKPGVAGAWGSANYVVNQRKNARGKPAHFPGPAYTLWVPAETLRDSHGAIVVLRLNADEERSWHTGARANDRGVAVVLQGNTTSQPLTWSHEECLEAVIPWCVTRYGLEMPEGLSWHADAKKDGARKNKPACPGKHAEAWLRGYLRGYRTETA